MNPRCLITAVLLTVASACDYQTDVPNPTAEGLAPAAGDELSLGTTLPPAWAECEAYCEGFMALCPDDEAFSSTDDCLETCAHWPLGSIDSNTDSLKCRVGFLQMASDDPSFCAEASLDSSECYVPEGNCWMYCHDYAEGCGADAFFDSPADCHAWCETKELGWHSDEGIDTIGCRMEAAAASIDDPAMCPEAGPDSSACGADSPAE